MMKETLTDDAILHVAETLFNKYGFNKVRIVDIAHQLGVTHTAIYKHFKSKDLIFQILLKRQLDADPNLSIADSQDTARTKSYDFLRALHKNYLKSASEKPDHFKSCVVYLRSNMDFNNQYLQVVASYMAVQTGISVLLARNILNLTLFYDSPIYLDMWSQRDVDSDFEQAWHLIKLSI